MSESRVFMLNGTEVQAVVGRLETFLHTEKGMEVQSSQTADGYVMQASQPKDGWKTLTGMRLAVTIQLTVFDSQLNVTVGEGQWADKIGAGALGLFIAWPLAITAGMGAFKQKKLPDEIFRTVENCIISGGRSAVYGGAETFGTHCSRNNGVPEMRRTTACRFKVLQPMRREARKCMPELRCRSRSREYVLLKLRTKATIK